MLFAYKPTFLLLSDTITTALSLDRWHIFNRAIQIIMLAAFNVHLLLHISSYKLDKPKQLN